MTTATHPRLPRDGEKVTDWLDGRPGIYRLGRTYLPKVIPDHW